MIKHKIKTRDQLIAICQSLKKKGKCVGFTSGSFDILHAGHVDYLSQAREVCDILVVGVNRNSSVKKYKSLDRPINDERLRIKVLAALESVDYAFLFEEERNHQNINMLKPDLYIKAGDYQVEELTSRKDVEKYGGKVVLIPVKESISTSSIIEKVRGSSGRWIEKENTVHIELQSQEKVQAVILDRDGTLNIDVGYLHDPEGFKFLENALAGVKKLFDSGYRIIIMTNQPGIGIGYFTEEDFYHVNRAMLRGFSNAGILVDKIYYCPHSKSVSCECRKPGQALIKRAEKEMNLDMANSYFVGDKTSDMETGRRAGLKTILVNTGFGGGDGEFTGEPDYKAQDLLDAAHWILKSPGDQ